MPRRFTFTPGHHALIADYIGVWSVPRMAREIGCDVTTLKRLLVRKGLLETETAKYLPARRVQDLWTRPCMVCRDDQPRPRGLYLCDRCRP